MHRGKLRCQSFAVYFHNANLGFYAGQQLAPNFLDIKYPNFFLPSL